MKGRRQAWLEGGRPEGKSRMLLANINPIDSPQNPTPPCCDRLLRASSSGLRQEGTVCPNRVTTPRGRDRPGQRVAAGCLQVDNVSRLQVWLLQGLQNMLCTDKGRTGISQAAFTRAWLPCPVPGHFWLAGPWKDLHPLEQHPKRPAVTHLLSHCVYISSCLALQLLKCPGF